MRSFTRNLHSTAGITLIEVLISTLILAFIIIGVTTISNNTMNTQERVLSDDEEFLQVETALTRIQVDLSHIYSPLYYSQAYKTDREKQNSGEVSPNTRYQDNQNYKAANDSLVPIPKFKLANGGFEFFTTSNRRKYANVKESQFAWVRYQLEPMQQSKEDNKKNNVAVSEEVQQERASLMRLVRYTMTANPYLSEAINYDNIKGFTVLENIVKLSFEFWDEKKERFVDSLTSVKDGESLLRGIRLIFTWKDQSGEETEIEKIFRPIWPYFVPQNDNDEDDKNKKPKP